MKDLLARLLELKANSLVTLLVGVGLVVLSAYLPDKQALVVFGTGTALMALPLRGPGLMTHTQAKKQGSLPPPP